ncbi:hypothetical protein WDW37_21055 [Bdellovibrionota bacterium FG-1]
MRLISLRGHSILDYVAGIVLLVSPAFFGFAALDAARSTFSMLGSTLIIYSLLTRYRYSIFKVIPVGFHMFLDGVLGGYLILAPYLMGYRTILSGGQWAVHVIEGFGMIMLVALTGSAKAEAAYGREEESVTTRRAA